MQKEKIKNNNKSCHSKLDRSGGFVILFAVVLSSIILAVTLNIIDILLKEVKFSTSAKDTNDAFFAADTGAECALFNDKSSSVSFLPIDDGGSGVVVCLGRNILLSGSYPSWSFNLSGLGSNGNGCARVTVDKTMLPITTVISKGYNNGGTILNACTPNTNSSIERVLELNY